MGPREYLRSRQMTGVRSKIPRTLLFFPEKSCPYDSISETDICGLKRPSSLKLSASKSRSESLPFPLINAFGLVPNRSVQRAQSVQAQKRTSFVCPPVQSIQYLRIALKGDSETFFILIPPLARNTSSSLPAGSGTTAASWVEDTR